MKQTPSPQTIPPGLPVSRPIGEALGFALYAAVIWFIMFTVPAIFIAAKSERGPTALDNLNRLP